MCKQERSSFPEELYSCPWTGAGRDHGGPASPAGPLPAHGAAQSHSRSPRGPRLWEGSEQSGRLPSENNGSPVPRLTPQVEEAGGSSVALSAPGRCREASKVGAGMWLEASPAVAGAWVRVSPEATARHPPPRHGAAATQGGHGPRHHQRGPLPFCVTSWARMSVPH